MHQLRLPKVASTSKPAFSIQDLVNSARELDHNKAEVSLGSAAIENALRYFVRRFFNFLPNSKQLVLFDEYFLFSSFLTFSDIRKVSERILILNADKVEPKLRELFVNDIIRKVIEYRDAWIHGGFVEGVDGIFVLTYFSGSKRVVSVTEGYLLDLDLCFKRFWELFNSFDKALYPGNYPEL